MKRSGAAAPWLAVLVGALVALLSVAAALVLRHSVADQNQLLLQSQANQVTATIESALTSATPQLQALQTVAMATNSSPAAFAALAKNVAQPGATVALVRSGRVVLAEGPLSASLFKEGQLLPAPLASAVDHGPASLFSPGVLSVGGMHILTAIVGPSAGGDAVLEGLTVNPSSTTHVTTGPFSRVGVAIYASPTAQANQLITTTARPLPFTGAVAKTDVPVGSSKWLVLTSASSPLAGAWPNALPWIILGVGLLFAVVLGVLVNALGRRERYAQELVAARTAELEAAQRDVVRQERLSAVGEMATMIGHELRNPLGAAINGLYLIRHHLAPLESPEVEKNLDMVERETNRAASLAEDLTSYMRERQPVLQRVELGPAVDQLLEASPPPKGIDVSVDNRTLALDADRAQLTQMLTNCVTNAYQAMPDGGSIRIAAAQVNGSVEIVVEDTGPGVDPQADGRAFDPFFTTKAQGTGLGLAIVQRMAEAHGGTVSLENRDSGGARVLIRLPAAEEG